MLQKNLLSLGSLAIALVVLQGCGQSQEKAASGTQATSTTQTVAEQKPAHDGWWCDEHGVPVDVCTRCNSKLIAGFKAKGDWCKKHGRPESQCFICHPEKEAEFAVQYEAKYGKKPPKPDAEHEEKAPAKSDAKT